MAKIANVKTPNGRKKLKPRNEPYWHVLSKCRSIGYRKPLSGAGAWTARVTLPDGKYVRQRLGEANDVGADPSLTIIYESASEAAIDWFGKQGGLTSGGRATVKQAMERYLGHLESHKAESTASVSTSVINKHILPAFGDTPLENLATDKLNDWKSSLIKKGLTKSTANRVLTILRAGLNYAYKEGKVSSNQAWQRVEKFEKADKARKLFFKKEQVNTFLEAARNIDTDFADICEAMFYAGTRPGDFELSVLRVKDVDLKSGTIEITEGKTGERTVYVPVAGLEVIRRRIKGKRQNDLVFVTGAGRAWQGQAIRKRFNQVIATTDLPQHAVPYVLRHSHISLALVGNLNIQIIAENCGTSIGMIEKHYGKFVPSVRRRLIDGVF